MHILKILTVAFLMVNAAGCGCSELGCTNGARISLKKTSGAWEPGKYIFAIDADGTKSNCTVDLPTTNSPVCTSGMNVTLVQDSPDAIVNAFDAATHVVLTISRDGAEIAKGDFTPTYAENQPNGPSCPPTCQQATASLTVP